MSNDDVRPYAVQIPDAEIDDLRSRLGGVRWPDALADAGWDSPAGWLAWVTQLFRDAVDRDSIITDASAYWLTGTIGSSIRRYYEDAHTAEHPEGPTTTPTGVAIFAYDFQSIREFADRDHANIVSWNRYDTGSHFATRDATTCWSRISVTSTGRCASDLGSRTAR